MQLLHLVGIISL